MVKNGKKQIANLFLITSIGLLGLNLNALTLKESVSDVINTNPVIKERTSNYRATQQDLKIAESEYLPSLRF